MSPEFCSPHCSSGACFVLWANGTQDAQKSDNSLDQVKSEAAKTGFSWKMASGTNLKVFFNQHTYAEAIIKKLPEFEALPASSDLFHYAGGELFRQVTTALNSRSGEPDLFMSGAYQIGNMPPLDTSKILNHSSTTRT